MHTAGTYDGPAPFYSSDLEPHHYDWLAAILTCKAFLNWVHHFLYDCYIFFDDIRILLSKWLLADVAWPQELWLEGVGMLKEKIQKDAGFSFLAIYCNLRYIWWTDKSDQALAKPLAIWPYGWVQLYIRESSHQDDLFGGSSSSSVKSPRYWTGTGNQSPLRCQTLQLAKGSAFGWCRCLGGLLLLQAHVGQDGHDIRGKGLILIASNSLNSWLSLF